MGGVYGCRMSNTERTEDWGVIGLAQLFDSVLTAASQQIDLSAADQAQCAETGAAAFASGMSLSKLIATFLGGAGEVWEQVFTGAKPEMNVEMGRALRRVSEQAVGSLAEGFEDAQRLSIRVEESWRRVFFDRLLSSESTQAELEEAAERIDFAPSAQAVVAVTFGDRFAADAGPTHRRLRTEIASRASKRQIWVTTSEGRTVIIALDTPVADLSALLTPVFASLDDASWRVGIGDPVSSLEDISLSYRQAADALRLGATFGLDSPIEFGRILPQRLLAADTSVAEALVRTVVEPLALKPKSELLVTLESFIEHGGNMAEVARALNIGARTVGYRLDNIATVTGFSPRVPHERFILELAYRMAPLLAEKHRNPAV